MSKKYNVYQETDLAAVQSAVSNMGLDPEGADRRGGKDKDASVACRCLVRWAIECLCDGYNENEAERALVVEVQAAKKRLASK